jgi:hypothetical protein
VIISTRSRPRFLMVSIWYVPFLRSTSHSRWRITPIVVSLSSVLWWSLSNCWSCWASNLFHHRGWKRRRCHCLRSTRRWSRAEDIGECGVPLRVICLGISSLARRRRRSRVDIIIRHSLHYTLVSGNVISDCCEA